MGNRTIEKYLQDHPGAKVLVLTHGQTILRGQYHDSLIEEQPGFKYCEISSGRDFVRKYGNYDVFVTLPQTLRGLIPSLPHFDLLVVDEAHHFYFADHVNGHVPPNH